MATKPFFQFGIDLRAKAAAFRRLIETEAPEAIGVLGAEFALGKLREGRLSRIAKRIGKPAVDDGSHPQAKWWHYFNIDISGVPSKINIMERHDGKAVFWGVWGKKK